MQQWGIGITSSESHLEIKRKGESFQVSAIIGSTEEELSFELIDGREMALLLRDLNIEYCTEVIQSWLKSVPRSMRHNWISFQEYLIYLQFNLERIRCMAEIEVEKQKTVFCHLDPSFYDIKPPVLLCNAREHPLNKEISQEPPAKIQRLSLMQSLEHKKQTNAMSVYKDNETTNASLKQDAEIIQHLTQTENKPFNQKEDHRPTQSCYIHDTQLIGDKTTNTTLKQKKQTKTVKKKLVPVSNRSKYSLHEQVSMIRDIWKETKGETLENGNLSYAVRDKIIKEIMFSNETVSTKNLKQKHRNGASFIRSANVPEAFWPRVYSMLRDGILTKGNMKTICWELDTEDINYLLNNCKELGSKFSCETRNLLLRQKMLADAYSKYNEEKYKAKIDRAARLRKIKINDKRDLVELINQHTSFDEIQEKLLPSFNRQSKSVNDGYPEILESIFTKIVNSANIDALMSFAAY